MPFVQQVDLRGNKLPYSVVRALLDNPQPFISELAKVPLLSFLTFTLSLNISFLTFFFFFLGSTYSIVRNEIDDLWSRKYWEKFVDSFINSFLPPFFSYSFP